MSKRHNLILAALTLLVTPAFAAQHKDPGSGCAVIGPRYLASSDYTFQYQGACKAGLAEGKGRAVWTLRLSPQTRVVWDGAFSGGVYLPLPAGIVSAREWVNPRNPSDTVIFDMGELPAQTGIPAARLKVEATSDLTNYPDPCMPRTAWVTNAPLAALAADGTAQSLLMAATDKLKTRCGAQLIEQKNRKGGQGERTHLQVRVVSTPDLESDRYGNPGPVVAEGFVALAPGGAVERYSNQAASQQRQQQQQTQDQGERQANVQRLRTFFQTHQAQGWASLNDIAQNPFRYAGRVVVTMAQVDSVLSPTRAALEGPDYSRAVLDGEGIASWKAGPRLLAVRVTGRSPESGSQGGFAQLQLMGSEACTQSRCVDWLRLPFALQDGQVP